MSVYWFVVCQTPKKAPRPCGDRPLQEFWSQARDRHKWNPLPGCLVHQHTRLQIWNLSHETSCGLLQRWACTRVDDAQSVALQLEHLAHQKLPLHPVRRLLFWHFVGPFWSCFLSSACCFSYSLQSLWTGGLPLGWLRLHPHSKSQRRLCSWRLWLFSPLLLLQSLPHLRCLVKKKLSTGSPGTTPYCSYKLQFNVLPVNV